MNKIPMTTSGYEHLQEELKKLGNEDRLNIIAAIAEAGADMFVSGSAIFNQPDYKAVIDAMRSELAKVES